MNTRKKDGERLFYLAYSYKHGIGVKRDYKTAVFNMSRLHQAGIVVRNII